VKSPETDMEIGKSCIESFVWGCTFGKTGQGLCYYGKIKTFHVVVVVRASSDAN
jgi:hypothetical protein